MEVKITKKVRVVTVAILVCTLLVAISIPALSQDPSVEDLVNLFISDPTTAMDQLLTLATTDPETVALVLGQVAEKTVELRETDPIRASILENDILLTCVSLVDVDPHAAALAVNTVKDHVPDIGQKAEDMCVAAGLEESYLRAASPVRP